MDPVSKAIFYSISSYWGIKIINIVINKLCFFNSCYFVAVMRFPLLLISYSGIVYFLCPLGYSYSDRFFSWFLFTITFFILAVFI